VDVEQIAWRIGVHEIVIGPIVGDGKLEQRGERTRILVQVRSHPTRRRFTIAHEVGHLWLQKHREEIAGAPNGGHAEERFCNEFAAALLMPPAWIRDHGKDQEPSLEQLDQIAGHAEVSLAACLLQLRRYAYWRHSLLHWSWDSGNWRLWSMTGVPRSCRRQISTLNETRRAISDVGRGGETKRVNLWFRIGEEDRRVVAEVKVSRGRAIALTTLDWSRPDAEKP
jgi:hypothetical protein